MGRRHHRNIMVRSTEEREVKSRNKGRKTGNGVYMQIGVGRKGRKPEKEERQVWLHQMMQLMLPRKETQAEGIQIEK